MQALKLPARRGWLWLAAGFAIFRKNPAMLTLLVVSYWMLVALINVIPVVGAIVATLCIPPFSVSLMNACRDLDQGRPIGPQLLFSGFRENLRALLILGGTYLGATITILGVSGMADGGLLMQMMLAGTPPPEAALESGEFLAAAQIALLLLAPLMMAYWYAPMLAAWHGFSPSKALFFSFIASMRNWRRCHDRLRCPPAGPGPGPRPDRLRAARGGQFPDGHAQHPAIARLGSYFVRQFLR
jgi:hypothetical protein